ncbi:MAG: response regulator [Myxococcales bacterium]|nr:response regulator [Myxococcales bacterium]
MKQRQGDPEAKKAPALTDETTGSLQPWPVGQPAVTSGAVRLVVVAGEHAGRRHTFRDEVVLGRGQDAGFVLDDPQTSRKHARIRRLPDGTYELEDLGSRNGTFVNGERRDRAPLRFGDRIQVGTTLLLFTYVDPAEERLAERQKLEALGRLCAGIAHDFNNLLSVVLASAAYVRGLAGSTPLSDAEVRASLDDLQSAATRAAELTRRLVHFARRAAPSQSLVDLSELCHESLAIARRTFGRAIRIEANVLPRLYVQGDRAQLHQLVLNLLLNARDAMPEGGTLVLELSDGGARPEARLPSAVRLTVRDTGRGMDEQTRARLFEPFFTTKEAGTGIGLATVHEVVVAHGGDIEVTSAPGAGTTFDVWLPKASEDVDDARRKTASDEVLPPEPSRGIVLVVDDDAVVRRSIARLLRADGHEVLEADGGASALARCVVSPEPDLVLLDIDMPEMDGVQCFREIRRLRPSIRVLFVSGHVGTTREQELRAEGAAGFLHKPFDAAGLRVAVQQVLNRQTA